jgi:DNA-binding beta-propeller fold protein YncE
VHGTAALVVLILLAAMFFTAVDIPVPKIALPWGGPQEPPVPGVRARSTSVIVRTGATAPDGQLSFMTILPNGQLAVTDQQRHTILRLGPDGTLLGEWGPRLANGVDLGEPAGIAFTNDTYWVVDRDPPRLIRLDANGRYQGALDLQQFSPYGLNGIAIGPQGNIYVADTGRNRLLAFSPEGVALTPIGSSGTDLGQFTQPMQVAFGPDGSMFVADWENARIQRFDRGLAPAEAWPSGFRSFGIAVDHLGRVYAPNNERRLVDVFSPHGSLLAEIGAAGSPAIDLNDPRQVALGPDGVTLYTLGRNGVTRSFLEDTPPPPQSSGPATGNLANVASVVVLFILVAAIAFGLARRGRSQRTHRAAPTPEEEKVPSL